MKRIFIIMLGLSSFIWADFTRNAEGIVTDSSSNLEWQDDYSDNDNSIKNGQWAEAISYCEALDLNGNGWRLPNLNELTSLVDDTKYDPAMSSVFQNTINTEVTDQYKLYYWSSTTDDSVSSKEYAFYIDLKGGTHYRTAKYNAYVGNNIKCVRAKR